MKKDPEPPLTNWLSNRDTLDALRNRSVLLGDNTLRGFALFLTRFKRRLFSPGEVIVKQGDKNSSYYVVEKGQCNVIMKKRPRPQQRNNDKDLESDIEEVVKVLKEYSTFGEFAVTYEQPQTATVVATKPTAVWVVEPVEVNEFLHRNPKLAESFERRRRIRSTIENVHWFLHSVDDEEKMRRLIDACSEEKVSPGEVVLRQGHRDEGKFYIIEKGELEVFVSRDGREPVLVSKLGVGDSFGELALLNRDNRRNATVQAVDEVVLLSISREQFHRLARASCHALWKRFSENASVEEGSQKFMTMSDLGRSLGAARDSGRAIELVFKAADQNRSHLVSWTEFVLLTGLLHRSNAEFQLAFLFCDSNGDGVISRDEFREAMTSLVSHQKGVYDAKTTSRLPIDNHELNDLFGDSGYLSYAEFIESGRSHKLAAVIDVWEKVIAEVQDSSLDLMVSATDTGEFIVMPGQSQPTHSGQGAIRYLICGGMSGAVSRLAVAPIIRVKMLMQTQSINKRQITGILQGLRHILVSEGWRGGFKGAGTNTIRIVPTTALQFLFFETIKGFVGQGHELTVMQRLLAGGFAGIGSAFLTYPLDFIRARLTIQSSGKPEYNGIWHGIRTVVKKEGPRALFRGLWPTMLGVFPYIGIDFAIYETLKHSRFCPHVPGSDQRTVLGLLACGGIAGLVSQTVAFPLELVRRRLQAQGFGGADYGYRGGVFDALHTTVQREGVRGLYCGLSANYMKAVPSIGIGFVVYERMKHYLDVS